MITIKDIARRLGISPSTVSRALKDHPDISPETKKAVIQLAQEMHYQPNLVAQNLRMKKTNTIAVVIPEIIHHFFASAISGIEDVAYDAGFNVMISQSDENYEREKLDLHAMISNRVDGIILSVSKTSNSYEHLNKIVNNNIPLILFDRVVDEITAHKVLCDDYDGAFEGVQHLIDIGCRKIVHLKGPDSLRITHNRLQGYLNALKKNNIAIDEDLIIEADDREKGMEVASYLIDKGIVPDGVFGTNDMATIGAMVVFKKRGFKVPQEVAFCGFSDEPLSSLLEPSLTTLAQPGYEMGQLAVRLCIEQIRNTSTYFSPVTEVLRTELIVRGSSNPNAD